MIKTNLILLLSLFTFASGNSNLKKETPESWVNNLQLEKGEIYNSYQSQIKNILGSIAHYENLISSENIDSNQKVDYLLKLRKLDLELDSSKNKFDLKISQFRYKKGIEIIKMIYEKILALDHHFTSLNTFQKIQDLSNPQRFPEFVKINESLKKSTAQKSSIKLPAFLDSNPIVFLGYSLISSIFGNNQKERRAQEIDEISCILDFTLSMHSDLKIIFYETEFLMEGNQELQDICLELFQDYTKVINYHNSLSGCRSQDDWDNIYTLLEELIKELEGKTNLSSQNDRREYLQQISSLEFSMDRLLNFVDNYTSFIKEGEQYYKKFQNILTSYENKEICLESLPNEYRSLESEIEMGIDKFKNTYNIKELEGSKLRELLYGVP